MYSLAKFLSIFFLLVGLKKAEHCKPYFVKKSEEAALKLQVRSKYLI